MPIRPRPPGYSSLGAASRCPRSCSSGSPPRPRRFHGGGRRCRAIPRVPWWPMPAWPSAGARSAGPRTPGSSPTPAMSPAGAGCVGPSCACSRPVTGVIPVSTSRTTSPWSACRSPTRRHTASGTAGTPGTRTGCPRQPTPAPSRRRSAGAHCPCGCSTAGPTASSARRPAPPGAVTKANACWTRGAATTTSDSGWCANSEHGLPFPVTFGPCHGRPARRRFGMTPGVRRDRSIPLSQRTAPRLLALALAVALAGCSATGSEPAATAIGAEEASTTAARLDALYARYWEERLELNPLAATFQGDPRYNDRLPNFLSPDYRDQSREFTERWLREVESVGSEGLQGQDLLSYEI